MKERPILFSGSMVRAILSGQKTQTRRVVKPIGNDEGFVILDYGNGGWPYRSDDGDSTTHTVKRGGKLYLDETPHVCPYGQSGDRLWVRESGARKPLRCPDDPEQPFIFRHDVPATDSLGHYWVQRTRAPGASYSTECTRAQFLASPEAKAVPSIHMPRWASRILLEVTGVRVERLQDISEADCWAEGIEEVDGIFDDGIPSMAKRIGCCIEDAKPCYACLWESINGPGSWDANPWVWVVEFKRLEGGAA